MEHSPHENASILEWEFDQGLFELYFSLEFILIKFHILFNYICLTQSVVL